jgi:hypothetical protein
MCKLNLNCFQIISQTYNAIECLINNGVIIKTMKDLRSIFNGVSYGEEICFDSYIKDKALDSYANSILKDYISNQTNWTLANVKYRSDIPSKYILDNIYENFVNLVKKNLEVCLIEICSIVYAKCGLVPPQKQTLKKNIQSFKTIRQDDIIENTIFWFLAQELKELECPLAGGSINSMEKIDPLLYLQFISNIKKKYNLEIKIKPEPNENRTLLEYDKTSLVSIMTTLNIFDQFRKNVDRTITHIEFVDILKVIYSEQDISNMITKTNLVFRSFASTIGFSSKNVHFIFTKIKKESDLEILIGTKIKIREGEEFPFMVDNLDFVDECDKKNIKIICSDPGKEPVITFVDGLNYIRGNCDDLLWWAISTAAMNSSKRKVGQETKSLAKEFSTLFGNPKKAVVICGDMLSSCHAKPILEELISYGYVVFLKSEHLSSKKCWRCGSYLSYDRLDSDGQPSWHWASCHDPICIKDLPENIKFKGFAHERNINAVLNLSKDVINLLNESKHHAAFKKWKYNKKPIPYNDPNINQFMVKLSDLTKGCFKNPTYVELRQFRCTGTSFKHWATIKDTTIHKETVSFSNRDTERGIQMEPRARVVAQDILKRHIFTTGITLHPTVKNFACSFDGVVYFDDLESNPIEFIIEIKCVDPNKSTTINEWAKNNLELEENSKKRYSLAKNHPWFYQIQFQLGLAISLYPNAPSEPYAKLFVYMGEHTDKRKMIHVPFDQTFYQENIQKAFNNMSKRDYLDKCSLTYSLPY